MNFRTFPSIYAALLVALVALAPELTHAQSPAALPNQESVRARHADPIDGVWTISTINKRIRIEGGRAYALDPWVHAMFWKIEPGMVVLRNIQRLNPGAYLADDLPLSGRATMKLRPDGDMKVKIDGALFPVRYRLRKNSVADQSAFAAELQQTDFSDNTSFAGVGDAPGAALETWHVYVKYAWCTGTNSGLFVKDVSGKVNVKASISSDSSRSRTTRAKSINALCKKKKIKKTNYRYKSDSAGFLELSGTRQQIADYVLRYNLEFWYGKKGRKSRTVNKTFRQPGAMRHGLEPGEHKDYQWKVDGKMSPDVYLTVRFRRTK